jgi:hypothetical protein
MAMDEELIELGRDIGEAEITPVCFRVGRLAVLNCGSGWLKITINHKPLDCEAELLPPEQAKHFINWMAEVGLIMTHRIVLKTPGPRNKAV